MRRWIAHSLRRKLTIIMLLTSLIPLLFLGGFAFLISSHTTEEKTKQSGIDILHQMEGNLQFIIKDVENMSIFLVGQTDIQQYLSSSAVEDMAERTRILGLLTNLVSSKDYISDITIYPVNSVPPLSTTSIYESRLAEQVNIREVREKMWTRLYTINTYTGSKNVISFIRPLRSLDNYNQTIGWICISLDEKVVSRYWSYPKFAEIEGDVALLDRQGSILSATDKSWLEKSYEDLFPGISRQLGSGPYGELTYGSGPGKKSIMYYQEPAAGWLLTAAVPYEQFSAQNRYILLLTGAALSLSVLATTGLILFFIRRVTNPLSALTRLLSKVNPNEPMPRYPAGSPDEIGRLAESYNMLGKHIEDLKVQVIQNEARKKESDMRALQAQINPHFLYNTLSSIHWIALMSEEKRIADMVGALSDFLRFSLNKGKEFCPVHQELAHIKNYVKVQSIRFPDKFDMEYTVDPALHEKLMLKLLLQPLIENAMIHGIQKKEGRGTISVYIQRTGSRMAFLVMDNGVGMTEEQFEAVRSGLYPTAGAPNPEASYGLRNVHERLQLHYGPDSGLVVESRSGAGTRVSFSIPIMEEQHENHDRG